MGPNASYGKLQCMPLGQVRNDLLYDALGVAYFGSDGLPCLSLAVFMVLMM